MALPLLALAGATVLSGISAGMSASAERRAAEEQGRIAERNMQIETERAFDAVRRGSDEIFRKSLELGQLTGTQTAMLAGRGISLDGSAGRILTDTGVMGAIDLATISSNAEREAWLLRERAMAHRAEAMMYRKRAKGIKPGLSALTAAAGTFLGGGGAKLI